MCVFMSFIMFIYLIEIYSNIYVYYVLRIPTFINAHRNFFNIFLLHKLSLTVFDYKRRPVAQFVLNRLCNRQYFPFSKYYKRLRWTVNWVPTRQTTNTAALFTVCLSVSVVFIVQTTDNRRRHRAFINSRYRIEPLRPR